MGDLKILDQHGKPIPRAAIAQGRYSPNPPPYAGADTLSQELATWNTGIASADADYLGDRNTIVARTRDLIRNDGWASSAVSRHLDNVVGVGFRLAMKPDFVALGLDREWAKDYAAEVEARFRLWSEDPDNWIDIERGDNFNGLLRLLYRHWLIEGEALAVPHWREDRATAGCAATAFQIIDPDRLSNPHGGMDSDTIRGGVEFDENGAPIAYHIQKAHPVERYVSGNIWAWERIERATTWGRPRVLHAFEKKRAGQSRGITKFAPIIERLKMIGKYDRIELQAALLNATFSAYIESPFDHELLIDALEGGKLSDYQTKRQSFHSERRLQAPTGVRIPTLFPGEHMNFQNAARPASQFANFEAAMLRNVAAGTDTTYEQLTQDWSKTNYSSARAAMLEIWKSMGSQRGLFADKVASPMLLLWLEEQHGTGKLECMKGVEAPDFWTAKAAYGRCKWIGQGKGYVDPEKEAKAANMRMVTGLSTLEDECAEQGKDWQEVLQQRAREHEEMKRLGIPMPDWASTPTAAPAEQTSDENGDQ